ncbi:glycosyltransferase family 2 protein [bacterium]|nr:glycosyltransferase family 2 protein [bacterium]
MAEPKISIIIPVYNVEKYLRECLDSCVNQTLEDIEIICVDDCSTDNSYKILEEYQQKDSRIRIFQQEENKKQGAARNKGLEVATGEYVWFVDSDDYIDTKACQILYDAIKEFDVNMLCFSAIQFSEENRTKKFFYPKHFQGVQINKVYHPQTNWKEIHFSNLNPTVWAYITKKGVIQNFKFREGVVYEDMDLTPILLASVDSFCYIPYTAYFYRTNPSSTTQVPLTQKVLEDYIASTINLSKFVVQNNIPKKHFLYIYFLQRIPGSFNRYKNNVRLKPNNIECLILLNDKYLSDINKIYPKHKKYSLIRFMGKVWKKIKGNNNV